jgi:hypothetical protein
LVADSKQISGTLIKLLENTFHMCVTNQSGAVDYVISFGGYLKDPDNIANEQNIESKLNEKIERPEQLICVWISLTSILI